MSAISEPLLEYLHKLRLQEVIQGLEDLYTQDIEGARALVDALQPLLADEVRARSDRTVQRRIKDAQFVRLQTVDVFNFSYNASTRKLKNRYLQLLGADMVTQNFSAVFVGNAGLGKTHLARALGFNACQRGQRVLFVPCASLLNQLVSSEAAKELERAVKKLTSPALLIIDELAYLTMSEQEANLFFQVISRRHDTHRPTVVTTNKPFGEWNQVFHSDATAHVIVDRLTERAEIFYLEGTSYRQTHRQGLEKPAKKKSPNKTKKKTKK